MNNEELNQFSLPYDAEREVEEPLADSNFQPQLSPDDSLCEKVRQFVNNRSIECDTTDPKELKLAALDLWDQLVEENDRLRGEFEAAKGALERDPRVAVFFNELMRGTPVRVALVRSDIFDFTPQNHDYDYDAYQEALSVHRKKRDEAAQRLKNHKENCEYTAAEIEKFYRTKGLTDDQQDQFADFVESMFDDFSDGKIWGSTLERLWKAFTYDQKLEEVKEIGRIEGVNAKIEKIEGVVTSDGLIGGGRSIRQSAPKVREGYIKRIMNGGYR